MSPESVSYHRWPIRIVSALVLFNGLLAVFEVVYIRFSSRLEALLPFNYESLSRNLGLFAGFGLIYFSGRLLARKRLAWYATVIGSLVIIAGNVIYAHRLEALIIPAVSIIVLLVYRDQFQVESEPITASQGLRLFLISIAIAIAYGTIGFYLLLRRDFGHDFNLAQSLIRTLREYSLIGNTDLIPRTRQAHWFLYSLDAFGALTLGFAVFSLFRPLSYRYVTLPADRSRAKAILDRHGHTSEDCFKLWPEDKAYFFGSDGDSFIAYCVSNGVAMALGQAVGASRVVPSLLQQFSLYCHRHDWAVAFLYLHNDDVSIYEAAGMRCLKIGEDAIIDLTTFTTKTAHNKHFRAVNNKFSRLGYSFEVLMPPQSSQVLRQTAEITRSWLKQDGRTERGFALGYHDRAYLSRSQLYIIKDGDGRMIAFANAVRSYHRKQTTIDLMRYRHDAETGVMDYLFYSLLHQLEAKGWKEFSFGLVPLSGLQDASGRKLEERILSRLTRINAGNFSFDGLRRYKNKFEPHWQSRYLAYERGGVGLGMAAIAISRLTKPKTFDD
jgi:phosphatidylglycerol lysyltransferase